MLDSLDENGRTETNETLSVFEENKVIENSKISPNEITDQVVNKLFKEEEVKIVKKLRKNIWKLIWIWVLTTLAATADIDSNINRLLREVRRTPSSQKMLTRKNKSFIPSAVTWKK